MRKVMERTRTCAEVRTESTRFPILPDGEWQCRSGDDPQMAQIFAETNKSALICEIRGSLFPAPGGKIYCSVTRIENSRRSTTSRSPASTKKSM